MKQAQSRVAGASHARSVAHGAADGSSSQKSVVRTRRLAEAVSVIRSRRSIDGADVLLEECLALLEAIVDKAPLQEVTMSRAAMVRASVHVRAPADDPFPELDGGSPAMDRLKKDMWRVARDAHVSALILGESGTGKERVARALHRLSPRASLPFVVVNCAGLSSTLAEDELFGHVRGAFTGAVTDRPGPFERANGGTVFLDEIGELPPDSQMKLLRALQQRTVQRLGSGHETPFDVRVIAATNADLGVAQQRGRFRQDLYYRLNVYELRVPPLRCRGAADLRLLVDAIVKHLGARRRRPPATLASAVWDLFTRHTWPGNVRELENTLERMIVAAGDDLLLTPAHMPDDFRKHVEGVAHPVLALASSMHGQVAISRAMPSAAEALAALERNDFNRRRAASDLGVSRHQLYRLLKRRAVPSQSAGAALSCRGRAQEPEPPVSADQHL
jgi:transcriptional regulator with PAS, ATPase and Fis domain